MKSDLFQSCGHCWVFQICWHIECCTFTASSFRIWKSSTGIPSPPLTLYVVMLSKAHLTSHFRMSGSRWVITASWLSWSWRSFLYVDREMINDRYFHTYLHQFSSVQFSHSVVSDSETPWIAACQASLVHHQLPEFTQTHIQWVSDAIQPSHPLSSPSPPAPNPSQHQSLFQWVNSSHEVAKVLEFQL